MNQRKNFLADAMAGGSKKTAAQQQPASSGLGRRVALAVAVLLATTAGLAARWLHSADRMWLPPLCGCCNIGCPEVVYEAGSMTDARFKPLKAMLRRFVEDGVFPAGRVAVVHKGELVADFVASTAQACMRPLTHELGPFTELDYTHVYSSGKAMEALAIGWLVDRGHLRWEDRLGDLWPEFACNGKEHITLVQFMRHEADLAWFNETVPTVDELNSPKMTEIVAKMRHNNIKTDGSPPRRIYHSLSRGMILSELTKKVDPKNRTLGQILQQEFVEPMGFSSDTDLRQTGLDDKAEPHLSAQSCLTLLYPKWPMMARMMLGPYGLAPPLTSAGSFVMNSFADADSVFGLSVLHSVPIGSMIGDLEDVDALNFNSFGYRRQEVSSAATQAKANVMAALASTLTPSGWRGKPYLSQAFREAAMANATIVPDGLDHMRFIHISNAGLFAVRKTDCARLSADCSHWPDDERLIGWVGAGGSMIAASPDHDWAFAFNMPSFYDAMACISQQHMSMASFISNTLRS